MIASRQADTSGPQLTWPTQEALDRDTQNVSRRRKLTYLLRETVRDITERERLRKCGHCRIAPDVTLVRASAGCSAWFIGLMHCGLSWCCPVCSSKIAARRAEELFRALAIWLATGRKVLFLTLTMPHDYGDGLRVSVKTVRGAYRRVLQGRTFQEAKAKWGIQGSVSALEITHGKHGWHPHMHILWFVDRALSDEEIASLHEWFFERWSAAIRRMKFRGPDSRNCPLQRVADAAIGRYLSKCSAANEMARWDWKQARSGNRSPFEILDDIREHGRPQDVQYWLEYEAAMYRVQQLTWSKGLRRSLGLVPDQGDAGIAAEAESSQSVAVIGCELWEGHLRRHPSLRMGLLEAAERGGFGEALAFLYRHIDEAPEWIELRFSDPLTMRPMPFQDLLWRGVAP